MLSHPKLVFVFCLAFAGACSYMMAQSLKNENGIGMLLAAAATIGVFYFLQLYRKLRKEMMEEK